MARTLQVNTNQIRPWKRRSLFSSILALGLFVLAARPIVDPDLWWHLKTGQLTLQNHAVFRVDPFSFTRAGQPWINHEWLSDVLMFSLYHLAGWGGLIVVSAAMMSAAYFLTFKRSTGHPFVAGICTLLAAFASLPVWDVRPQIFTLLFASIFLTLHEMSALRPRILWWTVPLMLLWVNLHAGYALGVALLVLLFLGDFADLLWGFSRELQQKRLGSLLVALLACIAIVPLNPYGIRMYSYPLATLRSASMQNHIAEWFSPDFHKTQYLPLALLMLAVIAALAISKKRLRPGELLLLLAANFAALLSIRHIAIYALVAAPMLSHLLDFNPTEKRTPRRSPSVVAFHFAILLVFTAFIVVHVRGVIDHQPDVEKTHFPARAVSFLAEHHPASPLLNTYDWGGYLIWRVHPQYPVFIDGRADLYGDDQMTAYANATSLKNDWHSVLERWHIRTVLLPPDSPLITALKASGNWRELYTDSQATILSQP